MPVHFKEFINKARIGALCISGVVFCVIYIAIAPKDFWHVVDQSRGQAELKVSHSFAGAVFPANMPGPRVVWEINTQPNAVWRVGFRSADQKWLFRNVQPPFQLSPQDWRRIKEAAATNSVELLIAGSPPYHPNRISASASSDSPSPRKS